MDYFQASPESTRIWMTFSKVRNDKIKTRIGKERALDSYIRNKLHSKKAHIADSVLKYLKPKLSLRLPYRSGPAIINELRKLLQEPWTAETSTTATSISFGQLISINAYNCPDKQRRIEVVYHERLDAATLSTTPIAFKGTPYFPLSSNMDYFITKLIFFNYQFQSSLDTGDLLYQRVIDFIQTKKKMGKVIRIEIPTFPSSKEILAPTHLFYVYVKGVYTPEDVSMERTLTIPHHQKAPVRIQWAGSTPFCNYCRKDGHILNRCPSRLSLICYKCKATGHIAYQCSRFSERGSKACKGKEPVRDPSVAMYTSSSTSSSSSPQSAAPGTTISSAKSSEVVPETIPSSPVPNTSSGVDEVHVHSSSFNFTPEIANFKFTPSPIAPSHTSPSSTDEELPPVTASQAAAMAALDVDVASTHTPNKPNKRQVDEVSSSSAQSVRSALSAFS
ncbi:hypothetical protein BGZ88_003963, partial [Linnemannia elongata]